MKEAKKISSLEILQKRYQVKKYDMEYIKKLSLILNSEEHLFIVTLKSSIDVFYENLCSNTKFH